MPSYNDGGSSAEMNLWTWTINNTATPDLPYLPLGSFSCEILGTGKSGGLTQTMQNLKTYCLNLVDGVYYGAWLAMPAYQFNTSGLNSGLLESTHFGTSPIWTDKVICVRTAMYPINLRSLPLSFFPPLPILGGSMVFKQLWDAQLQDMASASAKNILDLVDPVMSS